MLLYEKGSFDPRNFLLREVSVIKMA